MFVPYGLCPHRSRPRGNLLLAAALICSTLSGGPAAAQQAPATQGSAPTLDEVIVTAEKRESTVLKTPINITAVTGTQLQEEGISSIERVIQQVPGISFRTAGPGQSQLQMRGLDASGGSSPTVGVYLDDIPLTPPARSVYGKVVIDPDLYDLARVEVLRGPQGTLYGSGSMGGTLRLLTNQPDLRRAYGSAQTTGSGTNGGGFNYGESAMFNAPLIDDKVAVRVVETYKHISGWIDRIVLRDFPLPIATPGCGYYGCIRGNVLGAPVAADHKNVNDEDLLNVRASALIKVSDELTITPSIFYQRISMGGASTFDSTPGTLANYQPFDVAEPFSDRIQVYSLSVKYQLPGAEITSATSYWTRKEKQRQDWSEAAQALFGTPSFLPPHGVGPVDIVEDDKSHQASEELRIASTGAAPFQWLVGGFFSGFQSNPHELCYSPGFENVGLSANCLTYDQPTTLNQKAAFGEASYAITDKWKATTGLRWYSYTGKVVTTASGFVSQSGGPETTSTAYAANSGYNPKFNLSWTPTDSLDVYATAAKGFRPGGANQPIPESGPLNCLPGLAAIGLKAFPTQYKPDSLWSYELGEKAQAFGNRVSVNSAVYYERWTGVQQLIAPPCSYNFTDNAGDAAVYGSELEMAAKITSDLVLTISGGYTHAAINRRALETSRAQGKQIAR